MKQLEELERLFEQVNQKMYLRNTHAQSRTQGKILKILSKKGSLTQKELQEKLHVQPGTMSETIQKLVKKGFVVKKKDENDNRRMVIVITEQGLDDVKKYHEQYMKSIISTFEVLSQEERNQLKIILLKLLNEEEKSERE